MDKLHPMQTTAVLPPDVSQEQKEKDELIRTALTVAHDAIEEHVPDGRYKALAITSFEIASMWAIKALFHRK